MKTAAAYIRVSTEEQTEYSPASQLSKIRCYAEHNGYTLPSEYIFADEGISGRTTSKRTEFNRMISAAKTRPKPFDAILLWKFSRFARSREDSIVYKSMLRKQCGIDVISVSENIGDDKMSVLIEAMIEAMDEYYSINLGEEVRRGMNEKLCRGEAVTIPSFGYSIKDGVYVPSPNEAAAAEKIFSDFVRGKSMRKIADELNAAGFLTHRGNPFRSRTVRYILENPVYAGKIRWTPNGGDTVIVRGNHEPIVTQAVWNAACERLSALTKTKYMRADSPKAPFMMQGLIRCGSCGATLCRCAKDSLQCCSYAHGVCRVSHCISLTKLNGSIVTALDAGGCFDRITAEIMPAKTDFSQKKRTAEQLKRERCRLTRIYDAYENGVYTPDEFSRRRLACEAKIKSCEKELSAHEEQPAFCGKIDADLPSLLRAKFLTEEEKNVLVKAVIAKAVFHKPSGDIDIYLR